MNKIKPFERRVNSIETYDIDQAILNCEGNQFHLILQGAVLARKLAWEDIKQENTTGQIQKGPKPVVRAMQMIAQGRVD